MKNDPAFPCTLIGEWGEYHSPGLTKRELFAALAMHGMAHLDLTPQEISEMAVEQADSLLSELEKSE